MLEDIALWNSLMRRNIPGDCDLNHRLLTIDRFILSVCIRSLLRAVLQNKWRQANSEDAFPQSVGKPTSGLRRGGRTPALQRLNHCQTILKLLVPDIYLPFTCRGGIL